MPTVYVTAPPDVAAEMARRLVEERLAACVNRVPCESTYRWEGEIHADSEVVMLAKTSEKRCDALEDRIVELHPHDVPCVERFEETVSAGPFETWRDGAVEPAELE